MISCVAVDPPVPAVKPTHAVELPTTVGIFTIHEVEKLLPAVASVMVIASVVPSYVVCTAITSPLCRFTPELVRSVNGVVGEAPFVYSPVESTPSPALLYKSNFTATLLPIPGAPLVVSGPYPSPPPLGPSAVAAVF